MTLWMIALGAVMIGPAAYLAAVYIAYFVFWLFASNAIDYLLYPAILASLILGMLLILNGFNVL